MNILEIDIKSQDKEIMEDKKEKLLERIINDLNQHMHSIKLLLSYVSQPLTINDRGFQETLRHLRVSLDEYKFPQILGEMQFICKRLDKIENSIEKIKNDGIKKNIRLEFNCDGYELVKKPLDYDVNDPMEDPNKNLNEALVRLTDTEKRVLVHRFGLLGERVKTLEKTGELIGKSQERTRQIESRSLRKLRHPSRKPFIEKINNKNLKIAVLGKEYDQD